MFSKLMFVASNMRLNLMLTDDYYQTLKNRPASLRNNQIMQLLFKHDRSRNHTRAGQHPPSKLPR